MRKNGKELEDERLLVTADSRGSETTSEGNTLELH